jgi:hypothetical protein
MEDDPELKWAYMQLKATRKMASLLPEVRLPKSFTLSPEMAGVRQRKIYFPLFRFATVVAVVALAVVVGADAIFTSRLSGGLEFQPAPEVAEMMEAEQEGEKMLEVAPMEEVAEAPADSGAGLDEPSRTAEPETVDVAPSRALGEEGTDSFAEGESVERTPPATAAAEEPMAEQEQLPAATEGISQTATPQPPEDQESDLGRFFDLSDTSALRIVEFSLGALVLILGGLTLFFRRFR